MQAPQNVQMFALLFMVLTPQVALLFDKCESSTYLYVQMNADDYSSYELSDNLPPLLEAPVLKREPTMRGYCPGVVPSACPDHRPESKEAHEQAERREHHGKPNDDTTPDCMCAKRAAAFQIKKQESKDVGKWFFTCAKKRSDPTSCPFWQLQGGVNLAVQARDSGTNGRDM